MEGFPEGDSTAVGASASVTLPVSLSKTPRLLRVVPRPSAILMWLGWAAYRASLRMTARWQAASASVTLPTVLSRKPRLLNALPRPSAISMWLGLAV